MLAKKTVAAQVSFLSLSAKTDDTHRDWELHQGRAAERLAYVVASCPEESLGALQSLPAGWIKTWGETLRASPTLQPRERETLLAGARWAAARGNPKLAQSMAQVLASASGGTAQRLDPICGPMFRHLLIGLIDDWMARSGAERFNHSDSLLFMVASCPEDFYFVMSQRPEVLRSWLKELPQASFWGAAEMKSQLQSLRESLLALLQVQVVPSDLRRAHDDILSRLKTLCVTAVDQASPCPAQTRD